MSNKPSSQDEIFDNGFKSIDAETNSLPTEAFNESDTLDPDTVCMCLLLLDTSDSMKYPEEAPSINELNRGVARFTQFLKEDDYARARVEIAVITFGGDVTTELDWTDVDGFEPLELTHGGKTPLGQGINEAIAKIRDREAWHRQHSRHPKRPWLVIMSDGYPTDNEFHAAAKSSYNHSVDGKIDTFAIAMQGYDGRQLQECTPLGVKHLDDLKYQEFFKWLTRNLTETAKTPVGEKTHLSSTSAWEITPS